MPSRRQQSQPDRCGAVAVPAWGGCVCAAQQSIPADALTALSASGTRIPLFAFRCVCYNIGKNDMRKAGGYTKMAQQGLTILMDRARTGKSAALWREIAAEGLKGRQMLLVPEHASHQAEVDLCRVCGPHGKPACGGAELPPAEQPGAEYHRRHRPGDTGRRRPSC